ncbi:MAG: acyl--CoA ligase [Synergistaceae bacterium]|nr:acyl--CoA ligase [Synergistaceae bacterium]
MPITELLRRNAKLSGDDIAIVEINPRVENLTPVSWRDYETSESYPDDARRREITWRYMDEQANRVANFCLSRGIGKGNKVAILMMNGLEWFPIYFGILRSGALVVPLNYRNTRQEIQCCLELTQCDALFFGTEFIEYIADLDEKSPSVKHLIFVGRNCPPGTESYYLCVRNENSIEPQIPISDEDYAAIYFTSGTTGMPKAILQTHASLLSVCLTEQRNHGQTRDDVFLCMAPLFHTGAMMHWLGSLLSCSGAVLLRDARPESIMSAVSEERVTVAFMLVPWVQDILQAIGNNSIKLEDYKLDQWRLMHIGAQPVPPELVLRWRQYFTEQLYDTNYGLSEAMGPGCVHLGIENTHKVGAIGKAGLGWQTRIVGDDALPVKQGAIGELIVKGPGVMECYYNDAESTAAALRDGWLFTGDMGYEDEEGFIYLVDRKKDIIISGGENIYPIQIEDHLRILDCVKDVAVIGANDARLVETPIAIVSLKEGCTCSKETLESHCESLPRYKRPRHFIFDEVPRNPTGKIEKTRLREKYRDINSSK